MAQQFDIGDRVALRAHLRNPATGTSVDTTTVTFKVKAPDGTETTYGTPTHEGTGRYLQWLDIDAAGTWHIRVETTGEYVSAEETPLTVRKSAFV